MTVYIKGAIATFDSSMDSCISEAFCQLLTSFKVYVSTEPHTTDLTFAIANANA